MHEMNLVSSTPEKKTGPRRTFDKYFILAALVFFLTAAGFVGLRWYISALNNRLAQFDQELSKYTEQLRGDKTARVENFDQRLTLIEKQVNGSSVDPQKLLSQLEGLVISGVKLTKYNYNEVEKSIEVGGETDNFKSVAQQIISFKSENIFEKIKVNSLEVSKEGLVKFSLKATF